MTEFDQKAKGWDEVPGRRGRAEAVAKAIRRQVQLNRSMSALEYGCGTGLLSFALLPSLGQITLADSSSGMLDVLREKITVTGVKNMTPLQLDLSADPLPSQRFNLIYTLMVLHHIPDTLGILQKFHSLLHPGGVICIADLDKEDGTFHSEPFDGHHGFARLEFQAWMQQAGFTEITFTTPYSMTKAGIVYPLFLASGRKK
jgi:ubiquinone/menaquinone biosynthesis C-methylase UbiE